MDLLADERIPTFVGIVTITAGAALVLAPDRVGPPAGLGTSTAINRAVGLADLALTPGLLAGRPKWPWMAARAGLNVAIAAQYARVAKETGSAVSRAGAATLLGLTVIDGAAAVALRAAGR